MELFINKVIGKHKYTFVVQGTNLYELLMEAQKLSFGDVYKCGLCSSEKIILSAHSAGKKDEFKYSEVKCLECKGQLTFGQRKDDKDTVFLRRDKDGNFEWRAFEKKETENDEPF